jgi:hypothetical protein
MQSQGLSLFASLLVDLPKGQTLRVHVDHGERVPVGNDLLPAGYLGDLVREDSTAARWARAH